MQNSECNLAQILPMISANSPEHHKAIIQQCPSAIREMANPDEALKSMALQIAPWMRHVLHLRNDDEALQKLIEATVNHGFFMEREAEQPSLHLGGVPFPKKIYYPLDRFPNDHFKLDIHDAKRQSQPLSSSRINEHDDRVDVSPDFESWAWYQTFHAWSDEEYGIYITTSGLARFADRAFYQALLRHEHQSNPNPNKTELKKIWSQSLQMAFQTVLFHEYYHFFKDIAAATLEQLWFALNPGNTRQFFHEYRKNIYFPGLHNRLREEPLEEALANAFSWRAFCERYSDSSLYDQQAIELVKQDLAKYMTNQPSGYCHYDQFIEDAEYVKGNQQLISLLLTQQASVIPGSERLLQPTFADMYKYNVPVYVIDDRD